METIRYGPTAEFSLRVSVATLCRVIFPHTVDEVPMLALEHKATIVPEGESTQVIVKAQPFGGAIRILDKARISKLLEGFHFDSERSWSEGDFRIFIRPAKWGVLREYCMRLADNEIESDLEIEPSRELVEEFDDALGIQLMPEQYEVKPLRKVVENEATPTGNVRAHGNLTARIYYVFEVRIKDPAIHRLMIDNNERYPIKTLQNLALDDVQRGGSGRANAMLVAPFYQINETFRAVPPDDRGLPVDFKGTALDGNVVVVLEDVNVPKYEFY